MATRPRLKMLKPAIAMVQDRVLPIEAWRAGKTTAERGYGGAWQRARIKFLTEHPLCAMCQLEPQPRVTAAAVVDHRIPHRGDTALFWDESNWQSLCTSCHSAKKQREERKGG